MLSYRVFNEDNEADMSVDSPVKSLSIETRGMAMKLIKASIQDDAYRAFSFDERKEFNLAVEQAVEDIVAKSTIRELSRGILDDETISEIMDSWAIEKSFDPERVVNDELYQLVTNVEYKAPALSAIHSIDQYARHISLVEDPSSPNGHAWESVEYYWDDKSHNWIEREAYQFWGYDDATSLIVYRDGLVYPVTASSARGYTVVPRLFAEEELGIGREAGEPQRMATLEEVESWSERQETGLATFDKPWMPDIISRLEPAGSDRDYNLTVKAGRYDMTVEVDYGLPFDRKETITATLADSVSGNVVGQRDIVVGSDPNNLVKASMCLLLLSDCEERFANGVKAASGEILNPKVYGQGMLGEKKGAHAKPADEGRVASSRRTVYNSENTDILATFTQDDENKRMLLGHRTDSGRVEYVIGSYFTINPVGEMYYDEQNEKWQSDVVNDYSWDWGHYFSDFNDAVDYWSEVVIEGSETEREGIENLAKSESWKVRLALAEKGLCQDILVNDEHLLVRQAASNQAKKGVGVAADMRGQEAPRAKPHADSPAQSQKKFSEQARAMGGAARRAPAAPVK